MKDIFTAMNLSPVSVPSITFYTCDVCGMKNPKSHLADDAPRTSILCQPCWDRIQKDSK